ncbi:hypothetical protein [Geomonas sp.]|uniref:hypothetical protein n=1 Tax=Geomonas sp. TaxID=2651584 RepID=UPI002B471E95|nr:hypothetical protein [Geomonas sp.]HJV37003.1 hypothetical protein [Geomonas sp.]
MIDDIVAEMGPLFIKGVFSKKTTYRFLVDGQTISFTMDADSFSVEHGAGTGEADCTCQTSEQMFRKIWFKGYKPGIMDFMGGAIKSNAPMLLPLFLRAFGKVPA